MIIIDENVEQYWLSLLKQHGYEIISISELFPQTSDKSVIEIAINNKGILLTEDKKKLRVIFKKDTFGDLSIVYFIFRYLGSVDNVKVKYFAREYGSTKLSRFSNGLELTRNLTFAYRKIHAKTK
jgi:hypothetical protein